MGLLVTASTLVMLVGMLGMPSSFYGVLRVVVCLTAVVGFVRARRAGLERWQWVHGVMALVYNPIAPVYLHRRGMWMIVNLIAIALLWNGLRPARPMAGEAR